ncbi:MAG: S41 family peptidase [Alphaproteobacteria bacterium]|nr:S41 family peptidase [Alphaproteobacteria bacterium]
MPAEIKKPEKEDTFKLLDLFGDVFERVRSDYVEPVTDTQLVESAINGMLTSLDPHSSYMNEKAFKEMQVQTKGEFGGLGLEVTMENGQVKVVSPIDETPAAKAGVRAGDFIVEINGEPVMGLNLQEAVERMRGPAGTKITIKIMRQDLKEPLTLEIVRDVIRVKSVRARAEKDIAYIRITSFTEQTTEGVKEAYAKLEKEIGKDLKGVVLDLRNDPGGLLDQAIGVSDAFLERGEIVSTRGRDPETTKRYNAREGDISGGLPIVVLINAGSASASEIVAGAFQDHKRGIIMGTKSFGKGSVQTVMPLPGHGAMRLTTARYYTPSGHSIQAKGITPDIEVEAAKIEAAEKPDRVRKEADLRRRLTGEEEETPPVKQGSAKDDLKETTPSPTAPVDPKKKEEADAATDYQLARALDLLRGLSYFKPKTQ